MEKILATSLGRYKVLKLIQYLARFCLLLSDHHHHRRLRLSRLNRDRLVRLVRQCSLQRRILQLGNFHGPLKQLLTSSWWASSSSASSASSSSLSPWTNLSLGQRARSSAWSSWCSALSGLVEDASEDIFTLAQLGWLPHRFSHVAIYADRAWLVSLLLEFRAWRVAKGQLGVRKRLDRLLDQRVRRQVMVSSQPLLSDSQSPLSRRQSRGLELERSKNSILVEEEGPEEEMDLYDDDDGGSVLLLARATTRDLVREEWWLDLDGVRIMCDAGQAWCDVFEVEIFDGFVVGCALTSSILGLYRFVAKP